MAMRKYHQELSKDQSIYELCKSLKTTLQGDLDNQVAHAFGELNLDYDETDDMVKTYRIGPVTLESEFPAVSIYPLAEREVTIGEGNASYDYIVGIDAYMPAKQGNEDVIDAKIMGMSLALRRMLSAAFPGRGRPRDVDYVPATKGDALYNAVTIEYQMRVKVTHPVVRTEQS